MPQEAINAANTLGGEVSELTKSVERLTAGFDKSQKAARRWRWLTVSVVIISLVTLSLVVGLVVTSRFSAHQASCVRGYVNQNAVRATTVYGPGVTRAYAYDLWVASQSTHDQAQIDSAYTALLKANVAYEKSLGANPLPIAPKYTC